MAKGLFRRHLLSETACAVGERRHPRKLQVEACSDHINELRRQHRPVNSHLSPVGTAAVVVRKAVAAGEFPRAQELTGVLEELRITGERCDSTTDVEW